MASRVLAVGGGSSWQPSSPVTALMAQAVRAFERPILIRWGSCTCEASKRLGVSFDGSVWVVGTNPVGTANDSGVLRWNRIELEEAARGGVRISVEDSLSGGRPWIENSDGQIFSAVLIHA